MDFNFADILSRAWQITWKHKVLWGISVLPFLIGLILLPIWLFMVFGTGLDFNKIDRLFANQNFLIAAIFLYIVSMLGSIILQIVSRASATLGIFRAETEAQPMTFLDLLRDGAQYFWRIFGVTFIIGLGMLSFFLAFFLCMSVLSIATMGIASFCLQPFFILFIPLILLVMALMEQAESAVVADELGVMDALIRAYDLIRANVLKFILVTVVIYFGTNMLIGMVTVPIMLPMFFLMIRNFNSAMDFNNLFRLQAILVLVIMPFMILIQGFSLTYLKSAMMIAYLRLTRSTDHTQVTLQEAAP